MKKRNIDMDSKGIEIFQPKKGEYFGSGFKDQRRPKKLGRPRRVIENEQRSG